MLFPKAANRFGVAGRGHHTKMAKSNYDCGHDARYVEMMVYAKAADLDVAKVMEHCWWRNKPVIG